MSLRFLLETVAFVRSRGSVKNIALAVIDQPNFSQGDLDQLAAAKVGSIILLGSQVVQQDYAPLTVITLADSPREVMSIDLIVAFDPRYWDVYQKIGVNVPLRSAVMARDVPVIPYAVKAAQYPMLPEAVLNGQDLQAYRYGEVIYQYISRNNLTGSYAEFGTWFGRSFFRSYCQFNEQLKGDFWAFDSFGGLPPTRANEAEFTKGDFIEGRYFCNEGSFRAIGEMTFPNDRSINDRVKIVKGFYDQTLDGKTIADYGIKPHSISYCSIDCDLYDATLSVLRFIGPALENGALVYLDDYRMARAAKEASLYHAVKVWLGENPGFEFIELHRDHWQHQYMIFNRY